MRLHFSFLVRLSFQFVPEGDPSVNSPSTDLFLCQQHLFLLRLLGHQDDDVITSPYNSVLAMDQLQKHADCVIPVENQALQDIVEMVDHQTKGTFPRQ